VWHVILLIAFGDSNITEKGNYSLFNLWNFLWQRLVALKKVTAIDRLNSQSKADIVSQAIGLSNIYSGREDDIHTDRNFRFWIDYLITGNFYFQL
jgi:hypothetical protein